MQKRGGERSSLPSNYLTKTDEAKAIRKDENPKGRKQTTREKFKWQPRRTEEKKTHWMLQEAPFST